MRGVLQIPTCNSTVETLTKFTNLLIIQQIFIESLLGTCTVLGGGYTVMTKTNTNCFHDIFPEWKFFFLLFLIRVWDGEIYPKSGDGLQVLGERILQ